MRAWLLLLLLVAPAAAEPHGPIRIVSDRDFLAPGSGVTSGSGTAADPFIIEDLEIERDLLSLDDDAAIHIQATEAHVVVRDVSIHERFPLGVRVLEARNVTLEGLSLNNQAHGIWIDEARDVRVDASRVERTRSVDAFGIAITDSHRVHLRGVDVVNGVGPGVEASNSRFLRLEGVSVRDHEGGLRLQGSHDVALVSVEAANNDGTGIWLRNLTRFEGLGLVAHGQQSDGGTNTGRGILAWNVAGTLRDVQAIGNDAAGLFLFESNLPVTSGRILENRGVGLQIEASRAEIKDLEIHGNRQQGVAVFPGPNGGVLVAEALRIHDNGQTGLYAEGMHRMDLRDLRSELNDGAGVLLRDGGNLTLQGAVLKANEVGLQLAGVREGTVQNVEARENEVGVQVVDGTGLRFETNRALDNGGDGFDMDGQDLWLEGNEAQGNLGFGIRIRDGANATLVGNVVAANALGDLSDGVVQREAPVPWMLPALLVAALLRVRHQRT